MNCDFMKDREVGAEISMGQAVPHADHLAPWDVRVLLLERGGQLAGGFAHNLDGPLQGEHGDMVSRKLVQGAPGDDLSCDNGVTM